MTISTFLGKSPSNYHSTISEREHVSYHPTWKDSGSSSKNTQSALSALTLLAFLFFLNILQSCLRDSLQSQAPITIMMTTSTMTTETEGQKRHKRSEDKKIYNEKLERDDPNNFQASILYNELAQMNVESTKNTAVTVYADNYDYQIVVLEEKLVKNDSENREANSATNSKHEMRSKTENMVSNKLSNWLYDKACCTCEMNHERSKTKYSEEYLRVGISLMCEFIDAINMQEKCRDGNDCKTKTN